MRKIWENVSLYNKTLKMGLYREKRGKWNMKKTGIVICVLAALVGLAGCSSVVSSDKTDRTKSGQGDCPRCGGFGERTCK